MRSYVIRRYAWRVEHRRSGDPASHLPLRRRGGQHAPGRAPRRGCRRGPVALPRPGGVACRATTEGACSSESATARTLASPMRPAAVAAAGRPPDRQSASTTGARSGACASASPWSAARSRCAEIATTAAPLFRAARLQALAKGGETLLSGSTVDELGGELPAGDRPARPRHPAAARRAGARTRVRAGAYFPRASATIRGTNPTNPRSRGARA